MIRRRTRIRPKDARDVLGAEPCGLVAMRTFSYPRDQDVCPRPAIRRHGPPLLSVRPYEPRDDRDLAHPTRRHAIGHLVVERSVHPTSIEHMYEKRQAAHGWARRRCLVGPTHAPRRINDGCCGPPGRTDRVQGHWWVWPGGRAATRPGDERHPLATRRRRPSRRLPMCSTDPAVGRSCRQGLRSRPT